MSRTFRKILPILGVVIALGATPVFAQSDLPAEMRAAIDAAANAALKDSGAPGASIAVVKDGKLAYVQAYGDAKIDPQAPREASDALQHRLGEQAVHGDGDPDARRGREAVARRSGRQVPARPDARERGDDPAAAVAHVGLPGLLAAGLRAAVHAAGSHRGADPRQVGEEAARLRAGHAVPVQQHRLRRRGRDRREGEREAAAGVSRLARLRAARHGEHRGHRPADARAERPDRLQALRARAAARRAEGGQGLALRRGRARDDGRGPRAVGHRHDRPEALEARLVQADADGHAAQERPRHPLRPRHHRLAARRPAHARARRRGLGVHGGERGVPGRPRGHRGARQPGLDRHVRDDRPEDRRDPLRPGRRRTRRGAGAAGHGGAAEGQGRPRDLHVQRQQLLHRPGPRGFRLEPRPARRDQGDQADDEQRPRRDDVPAVRGEVHGQVGRRSGSATCRTGRSSSSR